MAMTIELLVVRIEILEKQMAELNITNSDSKTKRTSGYLMHNTARRAEVKARLEAEGDAKIKATDVTKELAVIWKALSDEERAEWNTKANATKESPERVNLPAAAVDLKVQFAPDEAELETEEIDIEVDIKKPKKEKKEKKEKDDKPKKKRVSGYILFQKAMREEVIHTLKEALEEADAKVKQSDVMSELGKMWKALDDEEREEWNVKAAEQKGSDSEE